MDTFWFTSQRSPYINQYAEFVRNTPGFGLGKLVAGELILCEGNMCKYYTSPLCDRSKRNSLAFACHYVHRPYDTLRR